MRFWPAVTPEKLFSDNFQLSVRAAAQYIRAQAAPEIIVFKFSLHQAFGFFKVKLLFIAFAEEI